ncbi:MAG: hydroxymethylbilane synthase, partial [Candidatus Poribacteria bacterium]|nr:hydroxymethylbilane synthase [Candidatus Poribacteria bacterium]
MGHRITIGTRGSKLALWQAEHVRGLLVSAFTNLCIDFSIIKTTGDQLQSNPPSNISKGLFTKEIEIALLDQKIDLAVHSVKDLPTDLPKGLKICCIPAREDPRDALISKSGLGLNNLPTGAKIGTSSLRRKSQLFYLRSDLEVVALRGNIDTRMRKLKETNLDAIVLAAAGVKRLFGADLVTQFFEVDEIVPAVGQGALGIEIRENDDQTNSLLKEIRCQRSEVEVGVERVVLRELGGGCQVPIGVNAKLESNKLSVVGLVSSPDGRKRILKKTVSDSADSTEVGLLLAEKLIQDGANEILQV